MAKRYNKYDRINQPINQPLIKSIKYTETITSFYIAAMISIFILYVGFGGYQSLTLNKLNLFYWISFLYIGFMAALGIGKLIAKKSKCPSPLKLIKDSSWTQRFVVLFLMLTVLSALFSPYGKETIIGMSRYEGLLTISIYTVTFLLVSIFAKPAKWQLYLFASVMTVFCIIALLQLQGYNPFLLYPEGYNYFDADIAYSGAYLGTIGNVDFVSALFCIAIPIFLFSIIKLTNKAKYLLLIPLGLCILILLWSNVQSGILGVGLGCLLTLPFIFHDNKKIQRGLLISVLSILVVAIVIVCIYDFGGSGTLFEAHELINGRWNDNYGSTRLFIWRCVFEHVPDRLLWGGGPDTLSARVTEYFQRYNETLGITVQGSIDAAHNQYLNILVNQGLLALICYLAALAVSVIRFLRARNNHLVVILGGAVLCYCIQAFFGISMFLIAPFFWLSWAMLERAHNRN